MKKNLPGPEKYVLLGIPSLFLLGSLFHFLYGFSGRLPAVGLLAPANESIFEHTKMTLLPAALWWVVYYLLRRKTLRAGPWLTAGLAAMLASALCVPLLYYFYTGASGVHVLAADIAILAAAAAAGQLLGLHVYRRGRGLAPAAALALILAVLAVSALLTAFPPKLPIFRDPTNGAYGMSPPK